jgi:hypothetical protein
VRISAAIVCALGALVLVGTASGASRFGVTDDHGKYAADGGAAFFPLLSSAGMSENAITVVWEPDAPTAISERVFLDRVVPQATARGIRLIFVVQPRQASSITRSLQRGVQFAGFLQQLAMTYPQVRDFVVGNEPNQPRFWQPQFNPDGSPASPAGYEALLASSYDALKAVDPNIRVLGVGLSNRGNDDPNAPSNSSISPVRFLAALGAAYRASGRARPIMDALALHPYPRESTDSLDKGLQWPNASVANLNRIKQALWDAFHGTAQPTVENGLPLRVTEVGWQTSVPAASLSYYTGQENVATADEPLQASIYDKIVRQLECDPQVDDVLFFHLIDEVSLEGFQSGMLRADGTARPAYAAVQQALAETGGRCQGAAISWRHTTGVVGGDVAFKRLKRSWQVSATAEEDVSYVAATVRVSRNGRISRARLARALVDGDAPQVLDQQDGSIKAYWSEGLRFSKKGLRKGTYVVAIALTAQLAPERTSLFVTPRFSVR